MKKTDYKAAWKKLRKTIKDDLRNVEIQIATKKESLNAQDLADVIEYLGAQTTYRFLLNAMEELQGKKHHNIFEFKVSK